MGAGGWYALEGLETRVKSLAVDPMWLRSESDTRPRGKGTSDKNPRRARNGSSRARTSLKVQEPLGSENRKAVRGKGRGSGRIRGASSLRGRKHENSRGEPGTLILLERETEALCRK